MTHSLLALLALAAACAGNDPVPRDPPDPRPPLLPDGGGVALPDGRTPIPPPPPVDDTRFDALSDAIRADLAANGSSAASVAVWLDEEIVWVGGFGTLDPGARAPGEQTVFMIGSDTKKITALSALRRVETGGLTLETSIADLFPDLTFTYATDYPRATLRQLLSMQGGIVDGGDQTTTTTDGVLESFIYGEVASEYWPLSPPGALYNYSNTNYGLAGLMDQTVDGRMWADIVTADLFRPLGMTRTFARKSEVDGDYAPGFGASGIPGDTTEGPVPLAEAWESAFSRPAGLVWSTPSDQMRLARFLVDGDPSILATDLLREVSTPQVRNYPDLPGEYGLGLDTDTGIFVGDDYYRIPVWVHGGDTLSHTSTFFIFPEQRFAISILSNSGADDFRYSVQTALATLVDLPAPSAPPPIPFDRTALDSLTGTYVDDYNLGEIIVTRAGDALEIRMPLVEKFGIAYDRRMEAVSTRVWIAQIDGGDADFSFIDGPSGETYMRNRGFVAIRPAPGYSAPPTGLVRPRRPATEPDPRRIQFGPASDSVLRWRRR